nr:hypothetical protein GCM10010200_095390 [Actinomadura rugatobispora]
MKRDVAVRGDGTKVNTARIAQVGGVSTLQSGGAGRKGSRRDLWEGRRDTGGPPVLA